MYRTEREEVASSPGITVIYAYIRSQPHGWTGYSRRIDQAMLAELPSNCC